MTERLCPICGAADARFHAHQSFEALPGSLVNGYDVVCCGGCGFTFATGLPSPEEFARYYASMSKYENGATSYATSPEDEARCESIVDMVRPLLPDPDVAVLDVGCATGSLLAAFKRRGVVDVEGMDPSPRCAVIARNAYGIDVLTGTTADIAGLTRRYGVVILSHVLEHLLDPVRALRDAWQILVDEGLLVVEVPDVEGFAACARAPFQEFSVEHINYFSGASLTSSMRTAGFDRVTLERLRVPWRSNGLIPVLRAVFRKTPPMSPPASDHVSEAALVAYIAESQRIEAEVWVRIRELASRGRPVLVWGVGTHTRHLLQSGALDGLRIAAWVDTDPKYEGTEMRGIPVLAPRDVATRGETILISSGTVHHEIERQIREELGGDREVVLLYE